MREISGLEPHNFTVLQAEGVAEAVRIAAEHHGDIDLLIANHSLADGTGRDAAERITQAWPDVKVLQYSGYPRQQLEPEGGVAEGVTFIQKPRRRCCSIPGGPKKSPPKPFRQALFTPQKQSQLSHPALTPAIRAQSTPFQHSKHRVTESLEIV